MYTDGAEVIYDYARDSDDETSQVSKTSFALRFGVPPEFFIVRGAASARLRLEPFRKRSIGRREAAASTQAGAGHVRS